MKGKSDNNNIKREKKIRKSYFFVRIKLFYRFPL